MHDSAPTTSSSTSSPSPSPADERAHMWALASRYSAVGIEMASAVAIGAVVGHWADNRYASGPWGLLVGFAIGLGAAVKAVARVIRMHRRDA